MTQNLKICKWENNQGIRTITITAGEIFSQFPQRNIHMMTAVCKLPQTSQSRKSTSSEESGLFAAWLYRRIWTSFSHGCKSGVYSVQQESYSRCVERCTSHPSL